MALKNVEIDQNDHGTEAIISPKNLDFGGYQNLFGTDTTRKYELVKSKNNAQTILKQLQNNFEKSQNLLQKYASPARTLQTISIIWFLINFYQKARSNKTETYRRHLTFIFRGLKMFVVFSHQNPQNLILNPSMDKKLFFEKIFHGRISNQILRVLVGKYNKHL